MTPSCATLLRRFNLIVAAAALAGCTEEPATSSVASPGMLNGMLNGFFHTEGLVEFLRDECPLLQQRLIETGNLSQPFPAAFSDEVQKHECESFLFYTAQLMVPYGQSLTLVAGTQQVASFPGKMGLQHLVRQAYPQYTFVQHAFLPAYPIARKIVTQGYAALTNGISRTVSFKTNIPQLDAHRAPEEDLWPREFVQLVPFKPPAIAAMLTNPGFLERLPDFFKPCDPQLTNYDYLSQPLVVADCKGTNATHCEVALRESKSAPPPGYCPVPVVVHGNLDFVDDIVPGRSCRILQPGEEAPPGTYVSGDVIVPEGGCPLIYYVGRNPNEVVYDDRTQNNTTETDDGCDVTGPSHLTNCDFDVFISEGAPVPDSFLDYYVFNVKPEAQP